MSGEGFPSQNAYAMSVAAELDVKFLNLDILMNITRPVSEFSTRIEVSAA